MDIAPSVGLHPPAIIKVEGLEGETAGIIDSAESSIKNEPVEDNPAGFPENIWVKEEIIEEETTVQELPSQISDGPQVKKKTNPVAKKNQVDRKKGFSCDSCPYRCDNKYSLVIHVRTHTGEKPYECDVCECKFRTSSHLITHKLKHTGERPYACNMCPAKFRDVTTLKNHTRTHTGEKPYVCEVCNARFSQISNLRSHELTHKAEKKFVCDFCQAPFRTSSQMNRHKLRHTGENPYKCGACPVRFRDLRTLKNHAKLHTGEKPYACGVCEAAFTQFIELKRHKRIHLDYQFACGVCGSKFIDASGLRKHKKMHALDNEKKDKENVTTGNVDDPSPVETLTQKEPAVDGLEGPVCTKSDESDSSDEVEDSSEKDNKKGKPHAIKVKKRHLCFACRYSSESLQDLKMHIRVHVGEKPYSCDLCEAKFRNSNLLRRHQLKIHKISLVSLDGPEASVDYVTSSVVDDPHPDSDNFVTNITEKTSGKCSVEKESAVDELDGHLVEQDSDEDELPDPLVEQEFAVDELINPFVQQESAVDELNDPLDEKESAVDELTDPLIEGTDVDQPGGPSEHVWIKMEEIEETSDWMKIVSPADVDSKKEGNQMDV